MFYDMHTHSNFSTDSDMTMTEAAKQAFDMGLTGIAFTDHLDVDYINYPDGFYYDYNEYFDHINDVIECFYGKVDIIKATEVGLQPHVIDETIHRTNGFDFDFKIGSTHLINRKDPYAKQFFTDGVSKHDSYIEYLEEIIKNIKLYNDYDALGHIDYVVRYAPFEDSVMYYNEFYEYFDEILKFIIKKDIAFEINTGTYKSVDLDVNLLKRYKELGGELVTMGSDAHSIANIGCVFDKYSEIIKSCGFDNLYYYKKRKPFGYKI